MKAIVTFLCLFLAVQGFAQRPEPTGTADRNMDPTQFQPPPPPVDTEPPVVNCMGGQTANLYIPGAITIWATDPITSLSDNVTPAETMKIGIRKAGTGNGFPIDASGNPITSITYDCQDLGMQQMEVWAIDDAGNAGFCTTDILIADQFDFCNQSYDSVLFCVKRHCDDGPIVGLPYNVDGIWNFIPPFNQIPPTPLTDSTGCGVIYIPEGSTITIAPELDDNPLNGLTTLDMLLIAKHILGLQPITDPYRLIAADANKSGSVTSFDIIEFQKLIKGIYTELPNNTSWRFVDASFQFPNPANPFMMAFPETISLGDNGPYSDTIQFYGIKIGDVNCSAWLDSLAAPDYPDANLVIKDTLLQAGQEYEMAIYMEGTDQWAGYQFALDFDPTKIQVTDIVPTQWTNAGNWAFYPGRISTSWAYAPHPVDFGANQPMSIVRIKALQAVSLSEVLQLSPNALPAEAYRGVDAEPFDLLLTFAPQFKAPEVPTADKTTPIPDPGQLVDLAPPVLTCYSGFMVNIMPTGFFNFWATDFVETLWDNATTNGLIELAVRKAGAGTGFPEDALGEPIQNALFTCLELGTQSVEVWARDLAGNTSVCNAWVIVQDNNSNCNGQNQDWNVEICAKTEFSDGLEELTYSVTGENPSGPGFTVLDLGSDNGCGHFLAPVGSNITASVFKDNDPLNGVTTFDLVLISKHIEGVEMLNSPYKMIAADADRNGIIDSLDILEFHKLLLGIYSNLPNNTSWRFVSKDFMFQDPGNPFIAPFPESVSIQNLQFPVSLDFVAIKVGDVNGSALPNSIHQGSLEDRDGPNLIPFIGQAYPNPTLAGAFIPLELYQPTDVLLSLYSLQGQLVWSQKASLAAGAHTLDIPADMLKQSGAYLWRVQAEELVKSGKLMAK